MSLESAIVIVGLAGVGLGWTAHSYFTTFLEVNGVKPSQWRFYKEKVAAQHLMTRPVWVDEEPKGA